VTSKSIWWVSERKGLYVQATQKGYIWTTKHRNRSYLAEE